MTTKTPGEAIVTAEMIANMREAVNDVAAMPVDDWFAEQLLTATGLPQRVRELEDTMLGLIEHLTTCAEEKAALEARLQAAGLYDHEFVSENGGEFCDVCRRSVIGHD